MNDEKQDVLAALGMLVLGLIGVALLTMWQGYVLTVLWGWFIVPLGVPAIGVAHAVGFAAMLALRTRVRGKDNRTVMQAFLSAAITAALSLGVGAIAHAFM